VKPESTAACRRPADRAANAKARRRKKRDPPRNPSPGGHVGSPARAGNFQPKRGAARDSRAPAGLVARPDCETALIARLGQGSSQTEGKLLTAKNTSAKAKMIDDAPRPERGFGLALIAVMLVVFGSIVATCGILLVYLLYIRAIGSVMAFLEQWYVQNFLYGMLIALANNVDNLGARIAYSLQGTRVSTPINLWISVITFVISFGAASLGTAVAGSFGAQAASVIAMALLVGLGVWMILQTGHQPWREEKRPDSGQTTLMTVLLKPHHADVDASKHIDFKEGSVLGIALSINNIGGGLSAGVIGVTPVLVGFLSALVSFVALWAGNYVAEFFVRRGIASKAGAIGGVLLIVIGLKQVF
jgi:putative sporulation protein YtaF